MVAFVPMLRHFFLEILHRILNVALLFPKVVLVPSDLNLMFTIYLWNVATKM